MRRKIVFYSTCMEIMTAKDMQFTCVCDVISLTVERTQDKGDKMFSHRVPTRHCISMH